jgi:hypothetical protein
MSQLAGVASYNCLVRFVVIFVGYDLVEDGDDKDCSFTHARLSLAENILAL